MDAHVNPLQRLTRLGQSVWLDYIQRGLIAGGELARLILQDGVSGVTSNPAIFLQAIAQHHDYDAAIGDLVRDGLQAHEIHEALLIGDIRMAADALHGVYTRSDGRDGFVSLEVSPHLARDTEGTFWEAGRLWTLVARPNLMIKVPGTMQGVPAVRRLIAAGINVNVTLLFSPQRYAEVVEAYRQGLEDRLHASGTIDRIASVASFFVSRIDTWIDKRLDAVNDPAARELRGQAAVACAQLAWDRYRSFVATPQWQELAGRGARPQRLLWASTGTKDPAYSDIKYVDTLIGPDTVTTLPPQTLAAYRDHGDPQVRLGHATADHAAVLQRLQRLGIAAQAAAQALEDEGIDKFIEPHEALLQKLRERRAAILGS